jgi:endoglucanase
MADHFRARRAFQSMHSSMKLPARLSPLLLAAAVGVNGACIGVSAKPAAGVGPGSPSAVKRCRQVRPADDGAVDDLEDGNTQVTLSSGRDGYWWSAADPNGSKIDMQTAEPGAGGSELAMHIVGKTVPGKPEEGSWGVQLGVNFLNEGKFYDASKYAGLAFKAKAAPDSARQLRFKIADINTHKDGGICTACWNHFGKDIMLTPEWREYRVTFSAAEQEPGWGDPRPTAITPSKLMGLNWQIGPGQTYDIWVDDVTFLDCE